MWRLEIGNKMPIKGSRLVFKKCRELGFRVCRKGKGHTQVDADTERDRYTVWSCGSHIFSITGTSSIGISSTIIRSSRYKLPSPQFVSHLLLPGPNPPRSIFNSIEDPHYCSTVPKARHLGNLNMQHLG
jgi:hypothetical protein